MSNFSVLVGLLCRTYLADVLSETEQDSSAVGAPVMADILALIEETYAQPAFSALSISKALGLSERHMRRMLKTHTGVSFAIYVRRLRTKRAKDLLIGSGESIKAIAGAVGYRHSSSFIKYFKIETGLAPDQFRRQWAVT
ncbi:MAG: helix-turn-helix transcriptional regulator [Acidobacteriaceae bacterium]|nr:helix-turn-helix transcriptional regulator [Acidobacteriaceae bacterium]MBV9764584.1 helix-turn-helix transcriptional regulator [Acidobacteriaceae bacterium]